MVKKYFLLRLTLKGFFFSIVCVLIISLFWGQWLFSLEHADRINKLKDIHFYSLMLSTDDSLSEKVCTVLNLNYARHNISNFRVVKGTSIICNQKLGDLHTSADNEWEKFNSNGKTNEPLEMATSTIYKFNLNQGNQPIEILYGFSKGSALYAYMTYLKFQSIPLTLLFLTILFILLIFIWLGRKEFHFIYMDISKLSSFDLETIKIESELGTRLGIALSTMIKRYENIKSKYFDTARQLHEGKIFISELIDRGVTFYNGALIRFDLNGYTRSQNLLNQKEKINKFGTEFYVWGRGISDKHKAKIYELGGDEFILILLSSEGVNEKLSALHLIQSAFDDLENFNKNIALLNLSPLTLKATYITGNIELEQKKDLKIIYSPQLSLTTRILSNITLQDKEISRLVLLEKEAEFIQGHADFSERFEVQFNPGDRFPTMFARKISRIDSWTDYHRKNQLIEHLIYLRSEKDLIERLRMISSEMFHSLDGAINTSLIDMLWKIFFEMNFSNPSTELLSEFELLLGKSVECLNHDTVSMIFFRATSQIITLSPAIYEKVTERNKIISLLEALCFFSDSQVAARAMDSLYKLEPLKVNLKESIESKNNRIAIDSWVNLVKQEGVSEQYFAKIKTWMSGDDFAFKRSCLYAIFEVSKYFKDKKPEYYASNEVFERLQEMILRFKDSDEPELRKWAQRFADEIP